MSRTNQHDQQKVIGPKDIPYIAGWPSSMLHNVQFCGSDVREGSKGGRIEKDSEALFKLTMLDGRHNRLIAEILFNK